MNTLRFYFALLVLIIVMISLSHIETLAQINIALSADSILTSYVSPWEDLYAINDGYDPEGSTDKTGGAYGNWDSEHNADWDWVEYYWDDLWEIYQSDVYWWTDNSGIQIPYDTYQLYWNVVTASWDTLPNVVGNGVEADQYNVTTFDTILTNRIRVYATSTIATGILEWKVWGQEGEQIPVGSVCSIDVNLAKGSTSTITLIARDQDENLIPGYRFKLLADIVDEIAGNHETYLIEGISYNAPGELIELPLTDEQGEVTVEVSLPAVIDPKDGISLTLMFNNGFTQVGESYTFFEPGLQPPDLTADDTDNSVDNTIDITFTDDAVWRGAITGVSIGTVNLLETDDYLIEPGNIILLPLGGNPALTRSGVKNISVHAAGYEDANVQQTFLTGAVSAVNSEAHTRLNLYLHTSTKIQLTIHDQYNNPVEGYVAKYDVNVTNATATTTEEFTIGGSVVTGNLTNQDFQETDESGQALMDLRIPDFVDLGDGVQIIIKLADGTNLSDTINYINDGTEKEIVLQPAVEQQPDFSWDRTAQSENFIVYWGGQIQGDPADAVNGNLQFDPNNILQIMEALLSYMIDTISFIDNADEGNMARYKHEIVMNETWNDENVFTGYAFGGWIEDGKAGGMWIHPIATGGPAVLAHEFTHMCQAMIMTQYPGYGLNASYAGFFWESHANYIMAQYTKTYTGVQPERFINTSMLQFSTTRHYYQNLYFIDYISDVYGIQTVNDIWRKASPIFSHPLTSLRDSVLRYTQADLNDDFGRYAMRNITWDYQNGPLIRKAIRSINEIYVGREYTIPDSLKDGSGAFVVPRHLAPGDYGYNIIPLFPDNGATEINLQFTGYANEPAEGAGNRYGFVAVDADGNSRYSDVYSDLQTEATFSLTPADSAIFLVVTGAPQTHHNYGWTTGFPKEYRYPYSFTIQGATPAGHKVGYNNEHENISGATHSNGGGWVASTASVAETVYVGPNAQVLDDANISGEARIEDYAIVKGDAIVGSSAVIRGHAILGGSSLVTDNVIIEKSSRVYGTTITDDVVITGSTMIFNSTLRNNAIVKDLAYLFNVNLTGTIIIGGDAEEWTNCTQGMYLQMGTVRTSGCDGQITHRLNEDVNPDLDIYKYPLGDIPASPLNLEASEITQVSVLLDWDESEALNPLRNYLVVQNGNTIQTVEETSTLVSDLVPGFTYSFYIRSMDFRGNMSASSDTIQITTLPDDMDMLSSEDGILIYPNPSGSAFTITTGENGPVSLSIFDSTGREVFCTSFTNELLISTGEVGKAGVYYAVVKNREDRHIIKIVVLY